MANDFYHLPHLLLASGLERLMKCYIALVYEDERGTFPDLGCMKKLGHDLITLRDLICDRYFGGKTRPALQREFGFITTDETLRDCLRILSDFGKFGRYYNLDVVVGSSRERIDPKADWETLESSIKDMTPFLGNLEALYRDYYPEVHAHLIGKLERFIRAIAFQFTIGDHPDHRGRLKQTSVVYSDFRNLRDEQLGMIDYRQSVRVLQGQQATWVKRSEQEITRAGHPFRAYSKKEFGEQWPFRADRVIVECRENLFCIVNIEGYAFALNGAAHSRFKFPYPHDAGAAVLGKSIGPFIERAFALRTSLASAAHGAADRNATSHD